MELARISRLSATRQPHDDLSGVTHGLVVHHFVNKEGLHRAVQQDTPEPIRAEVAFYDVKHSMVYAK